jgi:hypothetical protein
MSITDQQLGSGQPVNTSNGDVMTLRDVTVHYPAKKVCFSE